MNKKQKKYFYTWLVSFSISLPFFMFSESIIDNWASLKWPSFIIFMVLFTFFKDTKSIADAKNIHEYTNNHPWVIVYLGLFSITTVIFSL